MENNMINKQVGLEFSPDTLGAALKEILKKKYPFEYIGKNIIVLPGYIAEALKKRPDFKYEKIEIISLSDLPREEANKIRKRHLLKETIP